MPVYNYKCDVCGMVFEKTFRFIEDVSVCECPRGHSQTHRLFSPPTVIFKGSGFYVTDSRSKKSVESSS